MLRLAALSARSAGARLRRRRGRWRAGARPCRRAGTGRRPGDRRPLRRAAGNDHDHRRCGAGRDGRSPLRDDATASSASRSSPSTARPRPLARRQHARAQRLPAARCSRPSPSSGRSRSAPKRFRSRRLGLRRALAGRPHALRAPVPRDGANPRYNVRAVSLVTGKPVGAAIVDKTEPDEEMHGAPWARARSANGAWAYTLYVKPGGTAFVHALNTARRLRAASTSRGTRRRRRSRACGCRSSGRDGRSCSRSPAARAGWP